MPGGSLEAGEIHFQATGRQHRGCIIPQTVTHSLVLLKIGGINAQTVELIGIINKPLLLHLVGVHIIYTICKFWVIQSTILILLKATSSFLNTESAPRVIHFHFLRETLVQTVSTYLRARNAYMYLPRKSAFLKAFISFLRLNIILEVLILAH